MSVTQETFDNAVRENMELFDLEIEAAIKDTIQQFETQGVDLSNIIVDLLVNRMNYSKLSDAINNLKSITEESSDVLLPLNELSAFQNECNKGIQYRVFAGKEGAYIVILNILRSKPTDRSLLIECFKALTSLMNQQPDLLSDDGVKIIKNFIENQQDKELLKEIFKWTKNCCIMHEHNRQNLFDISLVDRLKALLNEADTELLKDILALFRVFVLDDDVRVEFGKAHEHARTIATSCLCELSNMLEKYKNDEFVLNDLLLTISSLLVRSEFCTTVENCGGIKLILDAMNEFKDNQKIQRQAFKTLKSLSSNDECKSLIIKYGGAAIMTSSYAQNKENLSCVTSALGCISALTLRNPDNSKAFFEAGVAPIIVETMKIHADNANVQKFASWAVRNMVSRSRYQNKTFLELGIEPLLKDALRRFKACDYDIKTALRDLECEVELKEEWTGKGGKLNTQAKCNILSRD